MKKKYYKKVILYESKFYYPNGVMAEGIGAELVVIPFVYLVVLLLYPIWLILGIIGYFKERKIVYEEIKR